MTGGFLHLTTLDQVNRLVNSPGLVGTLTFHLCLPGSSLLGLRWETLEGSGPCGPLERREEKVLPERHYWSQREGFSFEVPRVGGHGVQQLGVGSYPGAQDDPYWIRMA